MTDGEDHDLLRAWRGEVRETPGELLDRRILNAAESHRRRGRILPLVAAMAACLVLALYSQRVERASTPVAQLDTSTFGLYEGRGYRPGEPHSVTREKPDGFGSGEAVSP